MRGGLSRHQQADEGVGTVRFLQHVEHAGLRADQEDEHVSEGGEQLVAELHVLTGEQEQHGLKEASASEQLYQVGETVAELAARV